MKKVLIGLLGVAILAGCKSVYNTSPAQAEELANEGTVVVVRPDRYVLFGTRSMRDYLEVVYEEFSTTDAGLPVVRVGLRNKGGQHWWDTKGKNFTLFAKVVFYSAPVEGSAARTAPLYSTNKRPIPMLRGETADVVFTCPVSGARGYQMVLSEN
ncbi:MAG: hypothetical protein OES84_04855 [Kiritimatiellaceae bacterium]|nr:hypothetical protein [Kiritimatiellaceae bacterium]